jgi:flagellar assembly factor FliW
MIIKDTIFGDIQYTEEDLLTLPLGLVGMPNMTQYLILDFDGEHAFKVLLSTEDPSINFLITDPRNFRPDYDLNTLKPTWDALKIDCEADQAVIVLCTWRGKFENTTGNLLGPIAVNTKTRKGLQVILENMEFTTHESIPRPEMESDKNLEMVNSQKVG